jgi:phenylacetate-CoA ligase
MHADAHAGDDETSTWPWSMLAGQALRPPGPFDPWQAFNAGCDVWWGSHADGAALERRAAWRLRDLLQAASAAPLQAARLRAAAGRGTADPGRSALAAQRVSRLPLTAIEPIGRIEAMARFDEACTDRAVTLGEVRRFLDDPQRLGEAFLGRYGVWTSSGTSGTPGIWVHDARAIAVYDALESLRMCGFDRPGAGAALVEEWLRAPLGTERRYAMVAATGGHFAGNATVERIRRNWPWAARTARTFSIIQPLPALVAQLEAYQPSVLATYPTAAEVLAAERLAGRLSIRPREIWVGGEQLTEAARRQIAEAFGCRVRASYGSSECLSIAWECPHEALHVNADWAVLEPVDRQMNPVPAGTPSHTVLLTNLANHVQPIIRYDLGDSITLPGTRCACGSPMPVVRVEGRRDDVLSFAGPEGPVRLLPLALATVMEEDAGIADFQLLGRDGHSLVLRVAGAPVGSVPRERARAALRRYLDRQGLCDVAIVDDPAPPRREPISGKLRRVLRAPDGAR